MLRRLWVRAPRMRIEGIATAILRAFTDRSIYMDVRGPNPAAPRPAHPLQSRPCLHEGSAMARGVNKVILVGNLGADPDTRYMPSGKAVTNIRLATSESWKDRQTGDMQERTEWHSIVMYDKLGEIAAEYLRKGSQVYIEGKIRTRKWQDKEGKDRYTTEIIADQMQMLGSRGGGGGAPSEPREPRSSSRQAPAEDRSAAPVDEGGGGGGGGEFD